jgi:hypothetical protein
MDKGFVVQPAGCPLAGKGQQWLIGQLARGGPRPETVVLSIIRSLMIPIRVPLSDSLGYLVKVAGMCLGAVSGWTKASIIFEDLNETSTPKGDADFEQALLERYRGSREGPKEFGRYCNRSNPRD